VLYFLSRASCVCFVRAGGVGVWAVVQCFILYTGALLFNAHPAERTLRELGTLGYSKRV